MSPEGLDQSRDRADKAPSPLRYIIILFLIFFLETSLIFKERKVLELFDKRCDLYKLYI